MVMAPFTGIPSRVASNRPSRASSTVQDIVKKRDKQFKIETERVVAKRRKLHTHTAYNQETPPGYTFLPVGTNDLAQRCQEISRIRGCNVNVVNAKPISKHATDPSKVSHHMNRIGYHFRSEILDQAREELGYIYYHGKLVKASDLESQQQAVHDQGIIARTLAKYGVNPTALVKDQEREDMTSVRAAIKELFPRMPDYDLQQIMRHAWKEGSSRVGTQAHLELPRRVQLATVARIRHEYTDYDSLLKAFRWEEARAMVEPDCLKKVIEWRGENEQEDDDQLEEIVRETIIIDDDDEDDARSIVDLDADDTSDASVEVTHHVIADIDFGAESHDERPRKNAAPFRPRVQTLDERNVLRQKIGNARQEARAGVPPSYPRQPVVHTPVSSQYQREVVRVVVQPDQYGREVMVGGQRMLVGRPQPSTPIAQSHRYQPPPSLISAHGPAHLAAAPQGPVPPSHTYPPFASPRDNHEIYNQPVPSIEVDDSARRTASSAQQLFRPITPDREYATKRRRMQGYRPYDLDLTNDPESNGPRHLPAQPQVIDLISPVRNSYVSRHSPVTHYSRPEHNGQAQPQQVNPMWPAPIPPPPGLGLATPQYDYVRQPNTQHAQHNGPAYPVHGAPAPVQQAPARPPATPSASYRPVHNSPHPVQYASQVGTAYAQPTKQYYPQYDPSQPQSFAQNDNTNNQYGQQGSYYQR